MRIFTLLMMLFMAVSASADSLYSDKPMDVTKSMADELDKYRIRARQTLGHFNEKLKAHTDKEYYVITRLYEGDYYEQVFVYVAKLEQGAYIGTIASEPMGKVNFKRGAPITVSESDVVDWVVVKQDGTEEGNLLGKMIDLIRAGKAAFIYEMTPKNGLYTRFRVVSVVNGMTRQEIIDVVPKEVIERIEKYAVEAQKEKKAENDKTAYSYAVVKYPGWVIVE